MFKKLLFTLAFLTLAVPAFALQVGSIDTDISDMMSVVYDSGTLTSAVTSIDITGLDGDVDEQYELFVYCNNEEASDSTLSLYFGSASGMDANYSNYGRQGMSGGDQALGTNKAALRGEDSYLTYKSDTGAGKLIFARAVIQAKSGKNRTYISHSTCGIANTAVMSVQKIGNVWNNDTDNLTQMRIVHGRTDGIGIGSHIILLKKNSGGMRVGDLDVLGSVKDTWELVAEEDITSSCQDLTISGLSGDTDILYRITSVVKNANVTTSDYRIRFNGDGTSGHYGRQLLAGYNNNVVAVREADKLGAEINYGATAQNDLMIFDMYIYAHKNYVRTALCEVVSAIFGTTVGQVDIMGHSWNNTEDELTSICLNASQTTGIGVGSNIQLWKLNLAEEE